MKNLLKLVCLVIALGFMAGCKRDSGKVLNLYSWSEYFPKEVLADFEKQTGIKVKETNYDSNEKMMAKLESGAAEYDLVVPSDYSVQILIADGKLMPLDRAKLPNFQNLDKKLLGLPYDKENKYSIPLFWGTTGIGVNREMIKEPVDSWAALFDPKNDQKIYMLEDPRENFVAALKLMGKSVNETDEATLKQAAEMLKKQTKLVKGYDSDSFDVKLKTSEGGLVQGFNGQLAKIVREDPRKFYYVVPKEGATRWVDNLCIPAGAEHADSAHAFLNFILDAKVAAKMVNSVGYASANEAARHTIDPTILNDPNTYPPSDVLQRCELMGDIGKVSPLMDRLWTEIKAK